MVNRMRAGVSPSSPLRTWWRRSACCWTDSASSACLRRAAAWARCRHCNGRSIRRNGWQTACSSPRRRARRRRISPSTRSGGRPFTPICAGIRGDYYGAGQEPPDAGLAVARMVGHITYMMYSSETKFGRGLQGHDQLPYTFFTPEFTVESYLQHQGEELLSALMQLPVHHEGVSISTFRNSIRRWLSCCGAPARTPNSLW